MTKIPQFESSSITPFLVLSNFASALASIYVGWLVIVAWVVATVVILHVSGVNSEPGHQNKGDTQP
jgi:hypothetical protein